MTTTLEANPFVEFTIDQGSYFSRIVQCFDLLDQLIDFTNCTARMQIRRTAQSPIVLLEATNANGKLSLGTVDGNIMISLLATDTALLTSDGILDCKVTFPSGEVITAFSGNVSLNLAVTR
jgi:hypothetical protein